MFAGFDTSFTLESKLFIVHDLVGKRWVIKAWWSINYAYLKQAYGILKDHCMEAAVCRCSCCRRFNLNFLYITPSTVIYWSRMQSACFPREPSNQSFHTWPTFCDRITVITRLCRWSATNVPFFTWTGLAFSPLNNADPSVRKYDQCLLVTALDL